MTPRFIVLVTAIACTLGGLPAAAPSSPGPLPPARRQAVPPATPLVIASAGLQMVVPEGWKVQHAGDRYTLSTADQGGAILFRICEAGTWKKMVQSLRSSQERKLADVQETGTETDTVGGLHVTGVHGTATLDGKPAWWSIDVVQARKPVVLYTLLAAKAIQRHKPGYVALMRSLKKLR